MKELAARPRCALCRRPVQSFVEEEIFGRLRLVARCHGDREVVELAPSEATGLVFGDAFAGVKLLGVAR